MNVKNLEESIKFYREVLGFKGGDHVALPGGGAITIMESENSSIVPLTVGRMTFVLDPNGVRICLIEHDQEYKKKYMK